MKKKKAGYPKDIKLNTRLSTIDGNLSVAHPNKKSENVQFTILLSIIIIFILCSIPRLIILMHEVTIIDTIRFVMIITMLTSEPYCPMYRCCISDGKVGAGFPIWNLVVGKLNDLLLIINPSANFVVYSVINLKFR